MKSLQLVSNALQMRGDNYSTDQRIQAVSDLPDHAAKAYFSFRDAQDFGAAIAKVGTEMTKIVFSTRKEMNVEELSVPMFVVAKTGMVLTGGVVAACLVGCGAFEGARGLYHTALSAMLE